MSPRPRGGRVRRLRGVRARSRRIVTLRDADAGILRRRSRRIRLVDRAIRQLVADMFASMRRSNGIGLAAPQIGTPLRVVVIDIGEEPLAVINPRIRRRRGSQVGTEGCLSIPGVYGDVRRAQRVEVEGRNIHGRPIVVKGEDILARVFQHEIDHLNGVLFVDPGRLLRRRWPDRRPRVARRGR
ncbi:MAG TPA: peptide deformylase [bacterium]|nr:peptide deformylase [bacterium]